MATSEIKIKFTVEDEQSLDQAIDKMVQLGKVTEKDAEIYKRAGSEFKKGITEELKAAGVSAKTFGDALTKGATTATTSTKSLRAQLQEAKQAAVEAGQAFGQGSQEFANAAKRAGELKAELGDLNQTLDALDPDAKGAAFNQLGTAAFGAFQIATGALQAFGVENEKVNKLAQQFQGLLNLTQGLSQLGQIGDALKNVSTVLGLTTQAQKAAQAATVATTVAIEGEAVAATTATAATKGLTVALLTSPLAIIAAAFAALAGAVYLYNKENEDAIALAEELKKQQADLLKLNQALTESYNKGVQKAADDAQFQIDLAAAQGKGQRELIALEIEKQKTLERGFQFVIDQGKADKDQLREAKDNRENAIRQQQILEAKLTTFLRDEGIKRGEKAQDAANKRINIERQLLVEKQKLELVNITDPDKNLAQQIANQKQLYDFDLKNLATTQQNKKLLTEQYLTRIAELEKESRDKSFAQVLQDQKDEADRLAALRKQFDEELATQTKDIDEKASIQKLINAEKYFGKEKDLKLADIAAELQSVEAKIELNKVFGLETTTEQQKLYAQLALLRKEYDATNAAGNKTALQSFLKDNEQILDAAVQAYQTFSDALLNASAARTEKLIEEENEQFERSKQGTDQLLADKAISQQQYDDTIKALEEQRAKEIAKLQREQAIKEKALALFNAAIAGSLAVVKQLAATPLPAGLPLVLLVAAQSAAQIAAIAAQPIPKFAKGTLSVQGGRDGQDSVQAMVMPGEAIIPTRTNRKYKEAVRAIYHESVPADELAQFVTLNPQMRYALLMAAGEQFNSTIVNKPTNISTAQVMSNYISNSVRGGSSTVRGGSSSVDLSGLRSDVRNNKAVKIDNTKQLAQSIADALSSTNNARRKW
jgi:hypothetical protein